MLFYRRRVEEASISAPQIAWLVVYEGPTSFNHGVLSRQADPRQRGAARAAVN